MRKNLKTMYGKNLKMDASVYKLRRNVMKYIYEAKVLTNRKMKRVDVRIIEDNKKNVAGVARMNKCIIWIPIDSANDSTNNYLRHIVFHELLHAVYGIGHNEKCDLMCSSVRIISNQKQDKIFLSYAKKGVK